MAINTTITGYQEHITAQGEAFDTIALDYYNDEKQASLIMAANPDYIDTLIFDAGAVLKIPIVGIVETPETLPPWRRNE